MIRRGRRRLSESYYNRSEDTVVITVKLPRTIASDLRGMATHMGKSVSALIRDSILGLPLIDLPEKTGILLSKVAKHEEKSEYAIIIQMVKRSLKYYARKWRL